MADEGGLVLAAFIFKHAALMVMKLINKLGCGRHNFAYSSYPSMEARDIFTNYFIVYLAG